MSTRKSQVKRAPRNPSKAVRSGGRNTRSQNSRSSFARGVVGRGVEFTEEELNEFLVEEQNILPFIPDTEEFHYHWARVRMLDKDDGSNVHDKLNGRMGYEVVTPDKLPKGFSLAPLSIKGGDYSGGFQYRDCLLLRCPMRNFLLAEAAGHKRAAQLSAMVRQGEQAEQVAGAGTEIVVEENRDREGVRVQESNEDDDD